MIWMFAIIGAIALVITFNICKTTATDIAYLAASILLLGFVISLVVAPWQVKLFLLVLIFLTNMRRDSDTVETEPKTQDKEEQDAATAAKLQLSYRGEKYEVNTPPVELTEDEVVGKYRGQLLKSHQVKNCAANPNCEIKYRGAKITQHVINTAEANQAILDSFASRDNFINSGIINAKASEPIAPTS
ncbi:MAG: hypothetical protein Fur0025_29420 [Oscillatoriaceae cyanobacterium]